MTLTVIRSYSHSIYFNAMQFCLCLEHSRSHLQYLVLMGHYGGSAMNEVWFPFSVHPRSRNRITKNFFFFFSTTGTAYTSCFTEAYIFHCTSKSAVLQKYVKTDFTVQNPIYEHFLQVNGFLWQRHPLFGYPVDARNPSEYKNDLKCSQISFQCRMKTPQLFSLYFCE